MCTGKIYVPFDIRRDNGTNPLNRRNLVARLVGDAYTIKNEISNNRILVLCRE